MADTVGLWKLALNLDCMWEAVRIKGVKICQVMRSTIDILMMMMMMVMIYQLLR